MITTLGWSKQRNLAKDYTLGAVSKQSVVVPKSPSPLLEKIGLGPDDQLFTKCKLHSVVYPSLRLIVVLDAVYHRH